MHPSQMNQYQSTMESQSPPVLPASVADQPAPPVLAHRQHTERTILFANLANVIHAADTRNVRIHSASNNVQDRCKRDIVETTRHKFLVKTVTPRRGYKIYGLPIPPEKSGGCRHCALAERETLTPHGCILVFRKERHFIVRPYIQAACSASSSLVDCNLQKGK
jgi:hypothetical protein